jgi:DNA-binding response OmpR family regulator
MRGLTAGAVDYVIKPFDPDVVGKKIRARLARLGTKILVVDDDPTICDLFARKFDAAGFVVEVAEDGQKALDMMRASAPDLVLLDRMLPGFSGMTVLQTMREIPELVQTPVIFLTAKKQEADILAGFELGAADYIVKPCNPDEVLARCERLLAPKVSAVA